MNCSKKALETRRKLGPSKNYVKRFLNSSPLGGPFLALLLLLLHNVATLRSYVALNWPVKNKKEGSGKSSLFNTTE